MSLLLSGRAFSKDFDQLIFLIFIIFYSFLDIKRLCGKTTEPYLSKAAFHGSADAARVLLSKDDFDGITLRLHTVADKEGKTPLMHAKEEGNDDVAKVIEEAEASHCVNDGGVDEGLRKRK